MGRPVDLKCNFELSRSFVSRRVKKEDDELKSGLVIIRSHLLCIDKFCLIKRVST